MVSEQPPKLDLPETSILTERDYLEMYEVASDEQCYAVLELFGARETLDAQDIEREVGNGGGECIDQLVDAGLVQRRMTPNKSGGVYEYFAITSLGQTLVEEGVKDGVELLAAREHEFEDRYSG